MSSQKPSSSSQAPKPQRVLACVLCQQRKVKCDRKFPCSNCVKSRVQCMPGTLTQRRRRRRFPERDLLDRLRKYEDLLRQNNIRFDPLHKDGVQEKESPDAENGDDSDEGQPETAMKALSVSSTSKSEGAYQTKDPDNESDSSEDDVREVAVRQAFDQAAASDEQLLFGSRSAAVDLSTFHPDPVQIFRLWQIYLDNVNPMLKVTHTPSLQVRIIEAASNITSIDSTLEALMFSIYCMAILSLNKEECQTMFHSSREELMTRYQFGCQQALLNCGFLRSDDRESLTALYLYLVSVRPTTAPHSLYTLLGLAIRLAQGMGINSESALAKYTALEAEMRRRLWWSLVSFDSRMGELSRSSHLTLNPITLNPTWDCQIPRNVNDADLRPEMKAPPSNQGYPTEALFAVVRSELGEFIRHCSTHLDFTNPVLKAIAKPSLDAFGQEDGALARLEESIEERHFKNCDAENPVHFMTMWMIRCQVAKYRILEHHSRLSDSSRRTEAQHDVATSHALRMLECNTKVMASPLTQQFLWLSQLYFPFPAYIQILQDLRRRPLQQYAQRAWEVMSDNFEAWSGTEFVAFDGPFFAVISKVILQAWDACVLAYGQSADDTTAPRMVSLIKDKLNQRIGQQSPSAQQPSADGGLGYDDFSVPTSMDFTDQSLPVDPMMQGVYPLMMPDMFSDVSRQMPSDAEIYQRKLAALQGRLGWSSWMS